MSDAAWMNLAPILMAVVALIGTLNVFLTAAGNRKSGKAERAAGQAATAAGEAKTATEATKTAVETVEKKTDDQTVILQEASAFAQQAEKNSNGNLGKLRDQLKESHDQQIRAFEATQQRILDAWLSSQQQAPAPAQTIVVQPVQPAAPAPAVGMPGDRRGPDTTPTAGGRRAQDPKADPPKGQP